MLVVSEKLTNDFVFNSSSTNSSQSSRSTQRKSSSKQFAFCKLGKNMYEYFVPVA